MSNDKLTQEEIDRLMNPSSETMSYHSTDELSQMEKDIIGEVGNISMSQAATTLSELLARQVRITTPRVKLTSIEAIIHESKKPKVITSIEFKKGIKGNNTLMLDVNDSGKIANLMMGGDGQNAIDTLTELELSAVGEAMNQMIGSASTAMATMFSRVVDIYPPDVQLLDEETPKESEDDIFSKPVCEISFELEVENVLNSTIMQIFSLDAVRDIVEIMLNDKATVISDEVATPPTQEKPSKKTEKVTVQQPTFQPLEEKAVKQPPNNLDLIMDVPLEFSVVLGRSKKTIKDILSLGAGSVVELDKMTEEPLSIYVNGKMIAEGEVVVINENFGIRITNILSKENRLKNI
ncbi:Flagellar motor switch protein FliN [Jeotgalibaca dankookensis]|uniref:Flagellar motor switch protein FliN n=1 Tax=Jeotgalibaca dankookensis TaxID=708126 RepID=A0A1S6IRK3_9LACT|nr:flagellar motor switch phosphatase FliY [Jeotgalibaca dankookensis]AQS54181.1 Flagellar motor switch protein FliN [Jeotgalibaca dankookensis]